MQRKTGFLVPYDSRDFVELLDNQEIAELFKSLYAYAIDGQEPDTSGKSKLYKAAASLICKQISRDNEAYRERCAKNADAARKRWERSKIVESYEDIGTPEECRKAMEVYRNGL